MTTKPVSAILRRLANRYADERQPYTFTRYEMIGGHLTPVATGTLARQ